MLIATFGLLPLFRRGLVRGKASPSESGTPLALGPKGMKSGGLTTTKPSAASNAVIVEVAQYG
jgi:hypothetical protein